MDSAEEKFLPTAAVKKRYGDVTDMCLWNWLHDDHLDFPKPIFIGSRKYWRLSGLEAFERDCAGRKARLPDSHVSKRPRKKKAA